MIFHCQETTLLHNIFIVTTAHYTNLSVITKLELMGIQLAPENNRDLYGDKRDDEQKFGDTLAHIAKHLTRDDRLAIIELADGMVTQNKEKLDEQDS